MVENICMYADPNQNFTVAMVIPSVSELATISPLPANEAIDLDDVKTAVVKSLEKYGVSMGLIRTECPQKVFLTLDEWTPDSGLVTAAFKIRRRFIVQKYEAQIDKMYH